MAKADSNNDGRRNQINGGFNNLIGTLGSTVETLDESEISLNKKADDIM